MITIGVPAEGKDEPRIGVTPESVKRLTKNGAEVLISSGAGLRSHFSDEQYKEAGAKIAKSDAEAVKAADIVLTVRRPDISLAKSMKKGALLIGMLEPFGDPKGLDALAKTGVNLFAMELMPRITRAQVMDVLSSQSNLAGYKAVVDAAATFGRALPMMMTAAGTVPAAKVFIMGAGVAGLQAIATARRLGAIVTATDVRPAAKEQVESLGAKFVAVEDDEFKEAETAGGYAKEMSAAYKKKQADLISDHVKNQDIIVTTALIPGRPAPVLLTKAQVESMKPGSVIVDMAVERGGNVEVAKPGEIAEHKGVTIMGKFNLPGEVPVNASSLYAKNLVSFIEVMLDKEKGDLALDWEDEVIKGTAIAKDGGIVNEMIAGNLKSGGGASAPAKKPAAKTSTAKKPAAKTSAAKTSTAKSTTPKKPAASRTPSRNSKPQTSRAQPTRPTKGGTS
ncbi:NAD(P) transhydrogenase subunit alpha part 1 [Methyloligella halotolerans]|uniref:NAD(P) transhydrogenase subunit alpha n=1 Tax=Methyloligella halotolerans TaxID=1177755 RepID=A0A1E2RZD6_9HYPH|nr:Re/Si-specific NAD(P)(+) transhydrogenase subunit alpha [Methyloligella halotolerans]ODA67522.1 NAD(P) transhydrogenase subunit alpha part 1 [Methyloligella halotolerans]